MIGQKIGVNDMKILGLFDMKILGVFEYHRYKILFAGNVDETEYNVTVSESGNMTAYPSTDIRVARDKFQYLVEDAIYRTSFTDVSCYMQCGR